MCNRDGQYRQPDNGRNINKWAVINEIISRDIDILHAYDSTSDSMEERGKSVKVKYTDPRTI